MTVIYNLNLLFWRKIRWLITIKEYTVRLEGNRQNLTLKWNYILNGSELQSLSMTMTKVIKLFTDKYEVESFSLI